MPNGEYWATLNHLYETRLLLLLRANKSVGLFSRGNGAVRDKRIALSAPGSWDREASPGIFICFPRSRLHARLSMDGEQGY